MVLFIFLDPMYLSLCASADFTLLLGKCILFKYIFSLLIGLS